MQVIVHVACRKVGLVNHGTVRTQALLAGLSHLEHDGFHPVQHVLVT